MWFEKRSKPVSEPEQAPEHWSTERMILQGHAEYATREDLADASDEVLVDVAGICEVTQADPDGCIPCWAYAEYLERQQKRLEDMAPRDPRADEDDDDHGAQEFDPEGSDYDEYDTPKLDALMSEPVDTRARSEVPVVERFANHVAVLQADIAEMLDGPPIPPKDVSLSDLALLVLAADKWVNITEAQGLDLSPTNRAMLDSTKTLVARLRP